MGSTELQQDLQFCHSIGPLCGGSLTGDATHSKNRPGLSVRAAEADEGRTLTSGIKVRDYFFFVDALGDQAIP